MSTLPTTSKASVPADRPRPWHDTRAVSGATRHLAAGAYLDDSLRRTALIEVLAHPRRSVAPSAGFDLAFVLTHCARARRALIVRDVIELTGLVACLWVATAIAVELLTTLVLWSLTLVALRRVFHLTLARLRPSKGSRERAREEEDEDSTDGQDALSPLERRMAGRMSGRRWVAVTLAACLASLGVMILLARAAVEDLLPGTTRAVGTTTLVNAWTAIVVTVVAAPVGWSIWRQRQIGRLGRGHPAAVPGAASDRMTRFVEATSGNTTVHQAYLPFIGSGTVVNRWAFAVRLLRRQESTGLGSILSDTALSADEGSREFDEPPFTSRILIERLRTVLARLGTEDLPEREIPGLELRDHVYVPSDEIDCPKTTTSAEEMNRIIARPADPERHYLVSEVVVWDGELVTTVFLHTAVQGMTLYLESTTTALLPCRRPYRLADHVGGTGLAAYVRTLGTALVEAPSIVVLAPWHLTREINDLCRSVASRFLVDKHWFRGYDYGAMVSLRERAGTEIVKQAPQVQDIRKYDRIIERRILACVIDFLDEHDVDISELRSRAEMVLNAGVINTGSGSVQTAIAAGNIGRATSTVPG